jgi:hypothetical protein
MRVSLVSLAVLSLVAFALVGCSDHRGDGGDPSTEVAPLIATPSGYTRDSSEAVLPSAIAPTLNNENAAIVWGESYNLAGLLEYFQATKNLAYLDEFIKRSDIVLSARDDKRGYAHGYPVWSDTRYTKGVPYADLADVAMPSYPLIEFSYLVGLDPALGSATYDDGGNTYGDAASRYAAAIRETMDFEDREWHATEGGGYYQALPETRSYFLASNGIPMTDAGPAPYNYQSSMGRVHVYLYKVTGNPRYLAKADALAAFLKQATLVVDGALYWNYWDSPLATPHAEDVAHGLISVDFIRIMYNFGLAFTPGDIAALCKTFDKIYVSPSQVNYEINGADPEPANRASIVAGWAMLGEFDPTIAGRAKTVDAPGSTGSRYWVHAVVTRASTACAFDYECKTNVCLSATNQCSTLLPDGSACRRNVECQSKVCGAGSCQALSTHVPTWVNASDSLVAWTPSGLASFSTSNPASVTLQEDGSAPYHYVREYPHVPAHKAWRFSFDAYSTGPSLRRIQAFLEDANTPKPTLIYGDCMLAGTGSMFSGAGASPSRTTDLDAQVSRTSDGWYHCSLSGDFNEAAAQVGLALYLVGGSGAGSHSYVGDGSSGVRVRNVKLEFDANR